LQAGRVHARRLYRQRNGGHAGTIGRKSISSPLLAMARASAAYPSDPPAELVLHARSRVLELAYPDGTRFRLPFELMRVYSPSAEVRGHGPGEEVLQTGKREVQITDLTPIGHYAVQPPSAMGTAPASTPGTGSMNSARGRTNSGSTTRRAWPPPAWTAMHPCPPRRAAAADRVDRRYEYNSYQYPFLLLPPLGEGRVGGWRRQLHGRRSLRTGPHPNRPLIGDGVS